MGETEAPSAGGRGVFRQAKRLRRQVQARAGSFGGKDCGAGSGRRLTGRTRPCQAGDVERSKKKKKKTDAEWKEEGGRPRPPLALRAAAAATAGGESAMAEFVSAL